VAITQSKWRAGLLVTLGAMLFGFVTAFGAPFVSPFVTDWRLDSEVIGVAMDWRDFGEEKAKQRLAFELERQRLSSHVVYEDCTFSIEPQKGYVLSCLWDVVVVLPIVESKVPLSFTSVAIVSNDGDVTTW